MFLGEVQDSGKMGCEILSTGGNILGKQSGPPRVVREQKGSGEVEISPSLVDLESGQKQLSLGPVHLEDLHLVKEHIGLKKASVLLDYPSPEDNSSRYEGITLTEEEIKKCRDVCGVGVKKLKKRDFEYIVELPDDSDKEDQCPTVISADIENGLILRVSNTIPLKRHRDPTLLLNMRKKLILRQRLVNRLQRKEDTWRI